MSERALPQEEPAPRPRVAAIDSLKAISIVAIAWIHAFVPQVYPPGHDLLYVAFGITLFAVPAFFFASGFLYQGSSPIPWAIARRRLMRLAVPYLLASLIAEIFNMGLTARRPMALDVLFNVMTGNSLGIYYFVPLLMVMVFLSMVLSRMPRLLIPLLAFAFLLGFMNWRELYFFRNDFFWLIRDPFRWCAYFLFGWIVSQRWRAIAHLPKRALLAAGTLLIGIVCFYAVFLLGQEKHAWNAQIASVSYLACYVTISAIMVLAVRLPAWTWVRWLSDRSYAIYLYHFFFLFPLLHWLGPRTGLAPLAAWAAGLVGGALLGHGLRRLLGPDRARLLIGA